jgi:DNA helicase-2/ATP-dependent DNA helicase PcrA
MIHLDALNPEQRKAVLHYQGPVLVLAGAGSGKTRVITFRIAYLLQEKLAEPWEILAVTFTNKAAAEMRQRVVDMVGSRDAGEAVISTFHSFGARFLRRHAEEFERTIRFSIYDADDSERVIKLVLAQTVGKDLVKEYLPRTKWVISQAKESLEPPDTSSVFAALEEKALFHDLFLRYERLLKQNNAFDFDDLVTLPCKLLKRNGKLREKYRRQFRYVLIDEFQDTNHPQGELARLLAAPDGNITAVGDDDQSIYGWRGARLGNILQFEQDYRNVKVFRLEQNYRSTQEILNLAYQVIRNNRSRHDKKLWTSRKGGDKPRLEVLNDEREEAEWVVSEIQKLTHRGDYHYGDIVVLYRTNAQSRAFEEVLRGEVIPYVIVGGLRFYERREVKDFLSYLRLLVNPDDLISLQRIINLPPRGIGAMTLQRLNAYAASNSQTLFRAISDVENAEELSSAAKKRVQEFGKWLVGLREFAEKTDLFTLAEKMLHGSGLIPYYRKRDGEEASQREANLSELLNALREYTYASDRTALEDLEDFLQEVALVTDIDQYDHDDKAVTLMTLHAAKGLEYPVVFITGLEDGLLPLQNSIPEPDKLEEERRLFYVGATRAQDHLYLTYARHRRRWGVEIPWQPGSRFLDEIPPEYTQTDEEPLFGAIKTGKDDFSRGKRKRSERWNFGETTVEDEYPVGARVRHHTFGEGVIVNREGAGENLRLVVNFEEGGNKLLLATYAKLQRLTDDYGY